MEWKLQNHFITKLRQGKSHANTIHAHAHTHTQQEKLLYKINSAHRSMMGLVLQAHFYKYQSRSVNVMEAQQLLLQ